MTMKCESLSLRAPCQSPQQALTLISSIPTRRYELICGSAGGTVRTATPFAQIALQLGRMLEARKVRRAPGCGRAGLTELWCLHSAHRSQKAAVSVALSPPTAAPQLNQTLGCSALSGLTEWDTQPF